MYLTEKMSWRTELRIEHPDSRSLSLVNLVPNMASTVHQTHHIWHGGGSHLSAATLRTVTVQRIETCGDTRAEIEPERVRNGE